MFMGNANIIPQYRKYLYHAYLAYMEANGYRNVLSLKMFGLGPMMLKEYGLNYEKRHTKQGIQTNLSLKEESNGDWLPKCDEPAAPTQTGNSRSFFLQICKGEQSTVHPSPYIHPLSYEIIDKNQR
jgi:phage/plasmid-associated DNA primase